MWNKGYSSRFKERERKYFKRYFKTKGRKSYLFTGILDANKYIDILKNNLDLEGEFILQDDNDPKHRSKIVTEWKNENNVKSLDWPSNSPDLNPIENIWGLLKGKMLFQSWQDDF